MENISDYDLLMGNFDMSALGISENYTIEDFIKVTTEYRKSDRWFDNSTELALILSFTTLSVLGLSGNCLVCIVILLRKTCQSSRNWYIFNLAMSDILTCLLCKPFVIIRMLLKNWYLGEFMCKLAPALQTVYVFVSTLTILALSVDRYKAILYTSNRYKNNCVVRITIPTIWTISFVIALPTFLTHEVEPVRNGYNSEILYSICREKWESYSLLTVYTTSISLIQYLSPMVAIVVLHFRICQFLRIRIDAQGNTQTDINGIRRKLRRHRKNVLLLASMAVAFVVSWLPLTLINIIADINYRIFEHTNFPLIHAICLLVAFTSVFVNPVIYGWFNTNFRNDLGKFCRLEGKSKGSAYALRSSRNPESLIMTSNIHRDNRLAPPQSTLLRPCDMSNIL